MSSYYDWNTICKIRSLSKQSRRKRRIKTEEKFTVKSFDEQMTELKNKRDADARQSKIKELIETIKALQIIGDDATALKQELSALLHR